MESTVERVQFKEEEKKFQSVGVDPIPTDIKNGVFFGEAVLDNVVACLIATNAEMWATKRRLKVLEALLAKQGVTQAAMEAYVPTAAETAAWEKDRDRFVELTLGWMGNDGFRKMGADFPKRG